MKKLLLPLSLLIILTSLTNSSFSQVTLAQWALTSNNTATTTASGVAASNEVNGGNLTASITGSRLIATNDWTATAATDNIWADFTIQAQSGTNLTITSITSDFGATGGNSTTDIFNVRYLVDGNAVSSAALASYTGVTGLTAFASNSALTTQTSSAVSISVTSGNYIHLRVYLYDGASGGTKNALIRNFTITGTTAAATTTYYYKGTGALNTNTNWGPNTDGSGNGGGTSPANFTTANQIFEIRNATTITNSAAWTVSGSGSKIVLGNSGVAAITLTDNAGITGPMDIAAASSSGNTIILNTSTNPTFGTLNATSTVEYSGTGAQTIQAKNYGNLTISGSKTGSPAITLASGTIDIAGTFSFTATGVGSYVNTGNTVNLSSASSQAIPAINFLNLTNTGNGARVLASSGTIGIAGTFTPGSGAYTTTGSTVNFNGTTTLATAVSFNNLTVSGTSFTNNALTATVAGTFTVSAGTATMAPATGTSTQSYNNINVTGGSLVFSAATTGSQISTITISGDFLAAGGPISSSTGTSSANSISLTGTGKNINLSNAGNDFVKINTSISGSYTMTGNLNYVLSASGGSRTLTIATTGSLNLNGFTLTSQLTTAPFTITGSGVLTASGAGSTVNLNAAGAQTAPSTVSYANLTLSGSGAKTITSCPISGTLSIQGTATATGTPAYGGSSTLEYAGTAAQTPTTAEWPAASGPNSVKINNSAGVSLPASFSRDIAGTLTLTSGTFTVGANTLGLSNAIAGTATNLSAGSTSSITIQGSGSGINIPSSVTALNNLTINNSNGTTLQSNIALGGTLTLTSGNIVSDATKMITIASGAPAISGGGTGSYIDGPIKHTIASTSSTAKVYPVGKSGAYRPITLTITQDAVTSTTYQAEVINGAHASRTVPGTLSGVSSVRYFTITKGSGANITTGTILLNYSNVNGTSDAVTIGANARIARDNGTDWVDIGGTGTANNVGTITSTTNFTSAGDFILASAAGATQLVFVGVPGTGTTGNAISTFTVEARTVGNTLAPGYTGTVTLSKASGSGSVGGTLTATAVAGVATFSAVGFNIADTYTLTASDGSLTNGTSGSIVISYPTTNIYGGDGVNFVGQINSYTQPVNCSYGDYRVLNYRKVNTTSATPNDGRGQWVTTVNVQSSGGDVPPSNMSGGGGNGFLFTSGGGCGNTGDYTNKWVLNSVAQGTVNAVNPAFYQGSTDAGLDMSTTGRYTFVLKDNGYNTTGYYVGRTDNAPVTMTHNTGTQRVLNGDGTVTITTTLSTTRSSQENFYVRYKTTTNDFSTGSSSITTAGSVSGTTVTLTIPVQADGATVYYYIFSSTLDKTTLDGLSEGDKSYALLNYADNSGSNYSYTALSLTPSISSVVPTTPAISGQANNTGYKGQTITINGSNIQSNATVTFNGIAATSVTFVNSTQVTAVVANTGANSSGSVVVSNPTPATSGSASFDFIGYITTSTGLINTAANWLGGTVPLSGSTATINLVMTHSGGATTNTPWAALNIVSSGSLGVGSTGALAVTNAITTSGTGVLSLTNATGTISAGSIVNGGSLTWTAAGVLTITSGGTFTNNTGATVTSSTFGNVVFAGAGTINGTLATTFNNLTINGSTTLTTVPTITGTLQINSGSSVSAAPNYGTSSTLFYNTASYNRSNEWSTGTTSSASAGYPNNVTVGSTTQACALNLQNSAALQLGGILTIGAATGSTSSVTLDDNGSTPSPLTVIGNVVINATGTLTLGNINGGNAGDIKLSGTTSNWTNNGTFVPNSRAVFFNGASGNQTITKTGGETFDYVIVNKAAGNVVLANAVTINQTLTLTSGLVTLGANNLTFGSSGTSTGSSATSFINISSTGRVLKTHTGSFVYPIGVIVTTNRYAPVTITNNGASQTYTIGTAATTYPSAADGAAVQWTVAASGSSSTDIVFGWVPADAGANLNGNQSAGVTYRYNGSTWDLIGGSTSTNTLNTTTVTGITSFTNTIWTVALPPVIYYNVANSDVSVTTNWGVGTDGTGAHPANFTGSNATYRLYNGSSNTLGTSTTFSGTAVSLVIGDGSSSAGLTASSTTLTIGTSTASTGSLTVSASGTLTIGSTGSYTIASGGSMLIADLGTLEFLASVAPTVTGPLTVNGIYKVNPTTPNAQVIPAATYNSTCDLQILNIATGTDNIRIPGDVAGKVTWDVSANGATDYTMLNGNVTIGTFLIKNTGTRNLVNTTGTNTTRTLTVTNFEIQNGGYHCKGLAAGSGSNASSLTVNGTFTMSGGTVSANHTANGTSNPTINLKGNIAITGGTLTASSGGGAGTLIINGSTAQTINASGTYTLGTVTANNTSGISITSDVTVGTLTISGGLFTVNSPRTLTSSNTVAVTGGTLAGTGTIAAAVNIAGTGATISPAGSASYGTITANSMTLGANGTYYFDISKLPSAGTAGTDWDKIVVTGALSTAATFTVAMNGTIPGFSATTPYTWVIGTYASGSPTSSNIAVTTTGLSGVSLDGTLSVTFSGGNINLVYVPAPLNNNCAGAVNLVVDAAATSGTWVASTPMTGATKNDVFYMFTPPATGSYTITLNNLSVSGDRDMYVYSTCPSDYSTAATYADGAGVSTTDEIITNKYVAGTSYKILVQDFSGGSGTFDIRVTANFTTPPVATAATDLLPNSFTANWGAVTGATSYRLDVNTSNTFGDQAVASEPFENSVTLFTNSGGSFISGNSATADGPDSKPFASAGTYAWTINNNGLGTLTTGNINTAGLTDVQLSFDAAAFSIGTTGNGMDNTDSIMVEVSPNGGTTYFRTLRILGNGNAYWGYNATGAATTAYDGNNNPVDFQPAGGGERTTDGYSTVTITGLPAASNLRIRISARNNAAAERWVLDNFSLTGNAGTGFVSGYNNLTVSSGTSQSVTGLTPATTYYYRVRAVGSTTSANSNTITAISQSCAAATIDYTTLTDCTLTGTETVTITGTTGGTFSASPSGLIIDGTTGAIDVAASTPGDYTVTYHIAVVGSCSAVNATDDIKIKTTTWKADAATSNWYTSGNWTCGVPTSAKRALILAGDNLPDIDGNTAPADAEAYSITYPVGDDGPYVTLINDGILKLYSNTFNRINAVQGTIDLAGTDPVTIPGSAFITSTVKNLKISNESVTIAGSVLNVLNKVSFGISDATLATGDLLCLRSTAEMTAMITDMTNNGANSGNAITGKVTVQRYIPAQRGWRLMTSPINDNTTIFDSWQNGGVFTSGAGTWVTGPNPTSGPSGNGIDPSTRNNTSLMRYDAVGTHDFYAVTNTRNGPLSLLSYDVNPTNPESYTGVGAKNTGYFIFVRGDRTMDNLNNTTVATPTTLSSKGTIQNGPIVFQTQPSTATRRFTLIGNPYASPIELANLQRVNVRDRYYAWDVNLGSLGGYVTMDNFLGEGYEFSVQGEESDNHQTTTVIQSGQAFFTEGGDEEGVTPYIIVKETDKSTYNTAGGGNGGVFVFRPMSGTAETFRSSLFLVNADNSTKIADGTLAKFSDTYHAEVTAEDALKFGNINEMLGLRRDGVTLSVERRPLIATTDTLYLYLTQTTARAYRFVFEGTNLEHPGLIGLLEDKFLGTSTPLSLNGSTSVDFTVTADAGSKAADRFRVVFVPGQTVPVTFSTIKAWEQNRAITVQWNVENELNIKEYEVEKSTDGRNFSKVNTTTAKGLAGSISYDWKDLTPVQGANFYRIRSIGTNGKTALSRIVKVNIGKGTAGLAVYPNPVKDGVIGLQLNNMPAGKYVVRVVNAIGQVLQTTEVTHIGGNATQTISLSKAVAQGLYHLEVINPADNSKTNINFVKE